MTSPEQSLQALEWFETLADVDTAERARRLAALQSDAPELAAAVRELFSVDGDGGLEGPYVPDLRGLEDQEPGTASPARGDRLGPYELVRVLGEGGMGTVWEARRVEGGFDQRVAIKFLRVLAFGASAERRFAFEREVLGKVVHPAIARILDAGRTGAGVPYLVMEHVEGEHIDAYCDRRRLSVRERVRLVVEICRIVAHAHRNLVVHRDLKPANILVTAEGEPRLLDFGIAKLLVDDSSEDAARTALTTEGLGPMTLEYASPEQILGQPVTTTTDVYSLGVVLYELLTGRTPFARSGSSALALGRAVVEDDVTSPSGIVLSSTADSEDPDSRLKRPATIDVGTVAAARGLASPDELRRALRGDLDNVVLHALHRDPDRRYPSVDAFAADLERWLGGFPVAARGDSLAYRSAKFIRRNWLPVAAGLLIFLSLAIGLGIARWQAQEARRQQLRADDHAQRTEMVNRFLVDLLAAPGGRWWRDLEHKGPETRVIDVIDEAAARLETDLDAAPLQRASLHQTLNDTYLALHLPERAETQVRRALEIRRRALGDRHPAVAESTFYLAATLKKRERYVEALETYRDAIELERSLPRPSGNFVHALGEAGTTAGRIGRHDEMEELMGEAVEVAREHDPKMVGYFLARHACHRAEAGRPDAAWQLFRSARDWNANSDLGPKTPIVRRLSALSELCILWLTGDLAAAEHASRGASRQTSVFWRAQTLYDLGRFDEASDALQSMPTSARPLEFEPLLARLALELRDDPAQCRARARAALDTEESIAAGPTWYVAEARAALASCLVASGDLGDVGRAVELLDSAEWMLDALFDQPTQVHDRIAAARFAMPPFPSTAPQPKHDR